MMVARLHSGALLTWQVEPEWVQLELSVDGAVAAARV